MNLKDQSLSKTERLRRKADFDRVFKKGKSIVDPFFVVLYVKNSLPFSRIGVSIKRKFGKAHVRNRLRRLVKEVYRTNKSVLPAGYDILFIARKDLSDLFKEREVGYFGIMLVIKRIAEKIGETSDEKDTTVSNRFLQKKDLT
ncbi:MULTISPECIES: ribonuclease P protein component [unclassified Mesotoga]|uniref:ribonuclease P protein component n=1 Tax=unclassified Mesotoga TaxID=1184398 RepID=UPI000E8C9459|nr:MULTISPECIES: ribonuclease P protein component [unclassified Mesotoga]HAY99060.1 ribonuclease P protein component [Mesotoga sp.]